MDVNEVVADEKKDNTLINFIYGFIVFLAICAIFSLGKAIYQFYKERGELNVAPAEDNAVIECASVPSTPSILDRQEIPDNNESDSDTLHTQLDKLRRLLNRLNAMGTFSRDTIGDLSAQSTSYGNNSRTASSDLSTFWSSIDFDDFEETTIMEDKFLKPTTETSVSLSVSDFSLDASGTQYDKWRRKNTAASSNVYASNIVSSIMTRQNNPSDAIDQIIAILDSIMVKNKQDTVPVENNTLKVKRKSNESVNIQDSQRSSQSKFQMESVASQQKSIIFPSSISLDNKLSVTSEVLNPEIANLPRYKESKILNATTKSIDVGLTPKSALFDQMSAVITAQHNVFPSDSIQTKISKNFNDVNEFTSPDKSESFFNKTLSVPSNSESRETIIGSPSVSVTAAAVAVSPTQPKKTLESPLEMVVSKESHFMQNEKSRKLPLETNQKPFALHLGATRRSQSLSNLLDNTLLLFPVQSRYYEPCFSEMKTETSNSESGKNPNTVITVLDVDEDSKYFSQRNNEIVNGEEESSQNGIPLNNTNLNCVSLKDLHVPLFEDSVDLKPCVNGSEMKPVEMLSPSISSSVSVSFLSPLTISDFSPDEEIDWISPLEPVSDVSSSSNWTQHNEHSESTNASCTPIKRHS